MCEYCHFTKCPPGCPNYNPGKASHYCIICEEGIYEGDEYIENDGEYVHFDCVPGMRWLLDWLGYDVKEMEDIEYYKD